MPTMMALWILLSLALCPPVYAFPPSDRCGPAGETLPSSDGLICRPNWAIPQGEPASARSSHRVILRQIAIYFSIGNREGAEILIAQLRSQHVSEDLLSEAVTWAKLHRAPLGHGARTEHSLSSGLSRQVTQLHSNP